MVLLSIQPAGRRFVAHRVGLYIQLIGVEACSDDPSLS
ncbi:hypothetical protein SALB1_0911 [Salinisphaera sp. LB1]|nr:hypothetical protein SALB1_0911 [Salinisphaera sp. LB1]